MKRIKIYNLCFFLIFFIFILIGFKRCSVKDNKSNGFNQSIVKFFKHKDHKNFLKDDSPECLSCHPQHKDLKEAKELCHKCHNNPLKIRVVPQNCYICHINLERIKPQDHTQSWGKNHISGAKVDGDSCYNCHKQNFCTSCHTKRDDVNKSMHNRNFIFYHSVKARANPYKCASCHRTDYCVNCHSTRGVTK